MIQRYCLAVALTLIASFASAQETAPRPRTQATRELTKEVREFQKTLGLTPAQEAKRTALNEKYTPKIVAVIKKYQKERDAYQRSQKTPADLEALKKTMVKMKAESTPLTTQYQKELDAVYTPEQRAKLKAFSEKLKKRARK